MVAGAFNRNYTCYVTASDSCIEPGATLNRAKQIQFIISNVRESVLFSESQGSINGARTSFLQC